MGTSTSRQRLILVGVAISQPGTMGGNTKIVLEYARYLPKCFQVFFVVPSNKRATYDSVAKNAQTEVVDLAPFEGSEIAHPLASARHFTAELRRVFTRLDVGKDDYVLSCSDFHVETWPLFRLQKEFGFLWLPSMFLFVPGPVENLCMRYRFPFFKYVIYYLYQQLMFALQKARGRAFVVTNLSDFARFPARFKNRLYAAYGGVNVDQIPVVKTDKIRDVVFCSRLHPQKGIEGLLEAWALVHAELPKAKLSVIGNGSPEYEARLKRKAVKLGIDSVVEWLGYVNNEAKFKVYSEAKVFVHPTVYDNNGMVAAEALCSGLPVVMYDLPALREVYTTGCTKVPFGDKQAFADQVIRLLSDPSYYATIIPTSEQVAALRAHWDWSNRTEEFRRWLQSCWE